MNTDRIEKQIVLQAPIARVWSAVSDAKTFGSWFGAAFEGPFAAGARVTGGWAHQALLIQKYLAMHPA